MFCQFFVQNTAQIHSHNLASSSSSFTNAKPSAAQYTPLFGTRSISFLLLSMLQVDSCKINYLLLQYCRSTLSLLCKHLHIILQIQCQCCLWQDMDSVHKIQIKLHCFSLITWSILIMVYLCVLAVKFLLCDSI